MIMVDVSTRLRKAILQNDLALSKRILKANPTYLQNPDFSDKSNTSLHIAAQHGCLEIVEHLISAGHDASGSSTTELISWHTITNLGPSYNTDGDTPLHVAASHSFPEIVEHLCSKFPATINCANKISAHSVKASSKTADDSSTVEALLRHSADVYITDNKGDSCLHHASAWGKLKSIRALIQAGADPIGRNYQGWTPQAYSISFQAEAYYKSLVAAWEKRKAEEAIRMKERRGKGGGGLRIVNDQGTVGEQTFKDDNPYN